MDNPIEISKGFTFTAIDNEEINEVVDLLKANDLCYDDIPMSNLDIFKLYYAGEKVGFMGLEYYESDAILRSVVIKDEHRGNNYGIEMVRRGIGLAKQNGIKKLYLLTLTARDFFAKLGFEVIDRDHVPEMIGKSEEFVNFCPDTATCMILNIQ